MTYTGPYPCRNHPDRPGWVGMGKIKDNSDPKFPKSEYYLCKSCYEKERQK